MAIHKQPYDLLVVRLNVLEEFLGNASCTSATVFTKCCKTFSPQFSVWQVFIGNFGYMLELFLHSFPNGMGCGSEGLALL